MGTPAQTLYNYCNMNFAKARDQARMEDKANTRKYLFEALKALEILYNAERSDERRTFYEAKASEIYQLARDIRLEGFSPRVKQAFRSKDEYATYMDAPAVTDFEPLTEKKPDPFAAYMDKMKNEPPKDEVPELTLDDGETSEKIEEVQEEPQEEPSKQEEEKEEEHSEPFPALDLPEVPKEDHKEETKEEPAPARYESGGSAMRPQKLQDYFGQPQAVAILSDAVKKTRLSGGALPHVLLYGSQGLGKTTLAKILANEMQTEFVEISNARTLTVDTVVQILLKLKEGDIVFIDEIHNLPPVVAEGVLYSAMEDFSLRYLEGKGRRAENKFKELPRFTLVGATTEAGKLLKPFKDRFGIDCRLVPYTDDILANIAINSFAKLGMNITQELALELAKRARNTPRIVNRFVSRIADKALIKTAEERGIVEKGALSSPEKIRQLDIWVTADVIEQYFNENGIDEYGLTNGDRTLLRVLIETFNGGPAGQENLAKAMNESVNVISQQYENYLLKLGFINVLPKGRVAMPSAYRYLGLPVPEHIREYDVQASNADETNTSEEEPATAEIVATEEVEVAEDIEVTQDVEEPEKEEQDTQEE